MGGMSCVYQAGSVSQCRASDKQELVELELLPLEVELEEVELLLLLVQPEEKMKLMI